MTLKEFSLKYNFPYHTIYNSMHRYGLIVEHTQNVEYEEKVIYDAVMRYFTYKEGSYLAQAKYFTNQKKKLEDGKTK